MMPLFDIKCDACGHVWEAHKKFNDNTDCPSCGHHETYTLMPLMKPMHKAKDPYDMIGDSTGSAKKIKSFAKDHRKGGKDTT